METLFLFFLLFTSPRFLLATLRLSSGSVELLYCEPGDREIEALDVDTVRPGPRLSTPASSHSESEDSTSDSVSSRFSLLDIKSDSRSSGELKGSSI